MQCPVCNATDFYRDGSSPRVVCPDCDAKIDAHTGRLVDTERESRVPGPHCDSRIGMSSK